MIKSILAVAVCSLFGSYAEGTEPLETTEPVPETSEVIETTENTGDPLEFTDESEVKGTVEKVKDWTAEVLSKWLSPECVTTVLAWITYAGTIIVLAVKLKNLHRERELTLESVKQAVLDSLDEEIKKEIQPYMDKLEKSAKNTDEVMRQFAKILALSQENTPESRLAILELISQIGIIPEEDTDKAKAEVKAEVKAEAEKKEAQIEKLDNFSKGRFDGTEI